MQELGGVESRARFQGGTHRISSARDSQPEPDLQSSCQQQTVCPGFGSFSMVALLEDWVFVIPKRTSWKEVLHEHMSTHDS